MARLIHLNGPSGVGKSTLASRWVSEHPGSLNLDVDLVLSLIGGWEADFFATLEPARKLALAMITEHLSAGHDVVLPQLVTDVDEVARFEAAARTAGGGYVEVALRAGIDEQISRFRDRTGDERRHREVARVIDSHGGDTLLRKIDADFAKYLSHRPEAVRIDSSRTGIDATYARLLSSLSVNGG